MTDAPRDPETGSGGGAFVRMLRSAPALVAIGVMLTTGAVFSGRLDHHAAPTCLPDEFADGQRWICTFHDEFDGQALDRTKWFVQTGFVTGNPNTAAYACTVDDPKYISVSGGELHLTMDRVPNPVPCTGYADSTYESPSISTYHTFSQQYGRIEVRSRVTATPAPGLQESLWLWPDDRYVAKADQAKGEIDISEQYSLYPELAVPFLHGKRGGNPVPGVNTAWACAAARGVWNTFVFVSTPTSITISVNGKTCLHNTDGDPAFHQRYIMVLTQALGVTNNAPTPKTTIPATTDIDYVRMWKSATN
ncbi:hypothetical protein Back2_22850 [Nocardioides baekrokdamisoli]|uniref:GH16 domain-containing protein n=1 Tax=Nocardioides baekrokdamisoli TaxID=1804624 RepID=A0A3G9J311_9ACTN|nr:glycoside hydrolase family 16 protein [Nocardioides baekrokdamisoli]BBH17998.1 hypothetical protein Back2_22850 [Nocardioides baekrokdamisoli]